MVPPFVLDKSYVLRLSYHGSLEAGIGGRNHILSPDFPRRTVGQSVLRARQIVHLFEAPFFERFEALNVGGV